MPQDYGVPIVLNYGERLGLRNSSGVEEEGLLLGKSGVPLRGRGVKTRKVEFTRAGRPVCVAPAGAGAATGTENDINILMVQGLTLEYSPIGTQTILGPVLTSTGLNISQDLTNNDGVQYCPSYSGLSSDYNYTIGTSPAFYLECKIKMADVSGSDAMFIGFIKGTAPAAAETSYTDFALIGSVSGDIKIKTDLNSGGSATVTDTTQNWADGETHTLTVKVSASGVVTYLVDGANPTATAAFTFDTGDVVKPIVYLRHDTDVAETTELVYFECDYEK